jgi:hypothetical protein
MRLTEIILELLLDIFDLHPVEFVLEFVIFFVLFFHYLLLLGEGGLFLIWEVVAGFHV